MHPVALSHDPAALAALAPDGPDDGTTLDTLALYDGPMTDTAGLPLVFQVAADSVLNFAFLALWWHQSGRPSGVGMGEDGVLGMVLDEVATVAVAEGPYVAAQHFAACVPVGHWFSFGDEPAPGAAVSAERLTGLDTVLASVRRENSDLRVRLAEARGLVRDAKASSEAGAHDGTTLQTLLTQAERVLDRVWVLGSGPALDDLCPVVDEAASAG